jgi:hypothetical protein
MSTGVQPEGADRAVFMKGGTLPKIYNVDVSILSANGTQTYEIVAESPEEALAIYNSGGGDFVMEEVEITSLEKPDIGDFYEVEESNINKGGLPCQ